MRHRDPRCRQRLREEAEASKQNAFKRGRRKTHAVVDEVAT